MSDALEIIDRLPVEEVARLMADDYLAEVNVLAYEEMNVASVAAWKEAVFTPRNGKRGAAVVALQVMADDGQRGIQFGPMTLFPAFQVLEQLELNRDAQGTKKSARQIARRVRDLFKGWGASGLVVDMKPDKPCIEPIPVPEELGKNIRSYGVYFTCIEQPDVMPTQVGKPECDQANGALVLRCPTPGAVIYYTVDGSYPWAGNPQARVFQDAVEQSLLTANPTVIRFCAYKAGMIASWVSAAQVTPIVQHKA